MIRIWVHSFKKYKKGVLRNSCMEYFPLSIPPLARESFVLPWASKKNHGKSRLKIKPIIFSFVLTCIISIYCVPAWSGTTSPAAEIEYLYVDPGGTTAWIKLDTSIVISDPNNCTITVHTGLLSPTLQPAMPNSPGQRYKWPMPRDRK